MNKRTILHIMEIVALIFGLGYWFTMNSVTIDSCEYFGIFRYKKVYHCDLMHSFDHVSIEPFIFSSRFQPPYLYTYGVSGYTKTNVVPFGKVEKLANILYYDTVPDENTGPFESTLELLKKKYGSQLVLIDSPQDISSEDYQIYQELRQTGARSRNDYFSSTKKERRYINETENVVKMERNLDKIMDAGNTDTH